MTPRTQQWLVLAVVLMGTFMAILDVAIVNVAIPSIRGDLHASFGEVELVISAYTLTYACLLVTGGRLGDLYGRKRLFILGLLVFGAASALCGLAPNAWVLIGARAVQGIGGALMYPQVLAIIQVTFAGEERGKALGIFGSVIGLAAIAGQILGGLLLAADIWGLTWRPIFLVNVPLALGTMIAAAFVLGKDQRQDHVGLDWGGVGLITPALCLLVIPLLEGRELGWPVWLVGCLIAAVPIFGLFIWYERRLGWQGGTPLVPVDLFANRSFAFGIPIAGTNDRRHVFCAEQDISRIAAADGQSRDDHLGGDQFFFRTGRDSDISIEYAIEVMTSVVLIAQPVQRPADHTVAYQEIGRVVSALGNIAKLSSQRFNEYATMRSSLREGPDRQ